MKILLYHGVSPFSGHIFNYRRKFINPASFERQIAFLATHYIILPLDEAIARLQSDTLPPRALCITFDDGYRNNYDFAFPILKKNNVPATIFLATNFVFENVPLWVDRLEYAMGYGGERDEEKKLLDDSMRKKLKKLPSTEREQRLATIERERGATLPNTDERYAPLTSEQCIEMSTSGISFGAHTKSHPILSRLPLDDAADEIRASRATVREKCGALSSIFAYPNGQSDDWTDAIEKLLENEGFAAALTTLPGTNTAKTPRFELRRITMDGTDDWATFVATESGLRAIVHALHIWRK